MLDRSVRALAEPDIPMPPVPSSRTSRQAPMRSGISVGVERESALRSRRSATLENRKSLRTSLDWAWPSGSIEASTDSPAAMRAARFASPASSGSAIADLGDALHGPIDAHANRIGLLIELLGNLDEAHAELEAHLQQHALLLR